MATANRKPISIHCPILVKLVESYGHIGIRVDGKKSDVEGALLALNQKTVWYSSTF